MKPLVSVCIPFTAGSKFIGPCIESVYRQTYPNVEIVAIGKSRSEENDTRSAQKNRAALASKGEFIYIADADTILKEDALEKAVEMCEGDFDFVAINNRSPSSGSVLKRVKSAEWDSVRGSLKDSAAHFFRRADLIKAGLFDESMYAGEDYDAHSRMLNMGFAFGIVDSWRLHLGEPDSWQEVVRKNLHYGENMPAYLSKNTIAKVSPFRLVYLKNIPSFRLLFFPFLAYKAIQYVSIFIGMVSR